MARRWLIGLLVLVGALASPWTTTALAGTYSWPMPTASLPGSSNPDHDAYGAAPWSYVEAAMLPPASGSPPSDLPTYAGTIDGGLTGWEDASDPDVPFVAANRSGGLVAGEIPSGQLALQPATDRVVGIGWTSPLSASQTVAVNGTFTPDDPGTPTSPCLSQPNWTLELDGSTVAQGNGQSAIQTSATIAPGDTLYLIVSWSGLQFSQSCTTAGLSLDIQAPAATPSVSLSAPAAGQTISGAQPTFSGQASDRFGDDPTLTVSIWHGSAATGSPVETLSAQRSGRQYSVAAKPPLANGTYTARTEQDDAAGDVGLSSAVTFSIDNVAPKVTLATLPAHPLLTATPVIRGTAGTGSGDATTISLGIWSGSSVGGTPVRYLTGTRADDGSWSIRVTPALPDGRYSVLAAQLGAGDVYGVSRAQTFIVKVHPPALTLEQPAAGARLRPSTVTLSGQAGTALGDASTVSVAVYRGRRARGRALAHFTVPVRRGGWSHRLRLSYRPGLYTVLATQRDDAGHTARPPAHTFRLLAAPKVIAGPPSLDRSGMASIPITCTASTGSCTGQVLVLTTRAMAPEPGGPSGHVRVLFAYVDAPAGATVVVRGSVPGYVARALRRAAPVRVRVTASLSDAAGRAIDASATTLLRLAR